MDTVPTSSQALSHFERIDGFSQGRNNLKNNLDTHAKETPLSVKFAQAISEEMLRYRCCYRLPNGWLEV